MKSIQVDMFEVQLGASLLLQFRDSNQQAVTILADAGVHGGGYLKDHVAKKLPAALDDFQQDNRRIDLIVGTHYDADHLRGLPSVIDDPDFEFGEAWLPPVADDEEPNPLGGMVSEDQFLAFKWSREGGEEAANRYLTAKLAQCNLLREMEADSLSLAGNVDILSWNPMARAQCLQKTLDIVVNDNFGAENWESAFQEHLEECSDVPGVCECSHSDAHYGDQRNEVDLLDLVKDFSLGRSGWPISDLGALDIESRKLLWRNSPELAARHSVSFAQLRRSTAADAITASNLKAVISALGRRNVPIRCQIIDDGVPKRFGWSENRRRFLSSVAVNPGDLEILLLGPSKSLVSKHRDKLPLTSALRLHLNSPIPIQSITPSNQLSSIFRISQMDQAILVTGDAGCVDFKPKGSNQYFQALLDAVSPLHIVQVAHHGGNNAHFYRVLLESGYPTQGEDTFLLLSHATRDKKRPSDTFGTFVGQLRMTATPTILFTSEPLSDRTAGFEDLVHAPVGPVATVGEIRLAFSDMGWIVENHAIKV